MAARPQHSLAYRRLCETLRRLREDAGLTQRQLGQRLRYDHTIIHRAETGDRRIDPIEFIAWCRACEAEPAEVLGRLERAR